MSPITEQSFDMQNVHIDMTCSFQVRRVRTYNWRMGKRLRCVFPAITRQSHPIFSFITHTIDIYDRTAIIRYVERPHKTCSFRITNVNTCMHKMSYWKEVALYVWIRNSTIVSRIQLYPRKRYLR